MLVCDPYFQADYAHATWVPLLPFFRPRWGPKTVHATLRPFNDRLMMRDLALLCDRVRTLQPRLPNGRRLFFSIADAARPILHCRIKPWHKTGNSSRYRGWRGGRLLHASQGRGLTHSLPAANPSAGTVRDFRNPRTSRRSGPYGSESAGCVKREGGPHLVLGATPPCSDNRLVTSRSSHPG